MEPVITRKQPLGNAINCKIEGIKKRRTLVQAVRDFPPGCGFMEAEIKASKDLEKIHTNLGKIVDSNLVETNIFNNSKPNDLGRNKAPVVSKPVGKVKFLEPTCSEVAYHQKPKVTVTFATKRKILDNVDPNSRKLTSNDKDDNLVKSHPVENSKLKSFEPKELGGNKSYLPARSSPKVKFYDPICEAQKPEEPEVTIPIVSEHEQLIRKKNLEAIAIYEQVYESLYQENRSKPTGKIPPFRVPQEAAKIVKQKLKWRNPGKVSGSVCGVEVGDMFKHRAQLKMIGLHCQLHSGIDYMEIEGKNLAISVVDAHRYSNESGTGDTLVYIGQGGVSVFGRKLPPEDQKLERGNLAMKNSMHKKSVVRVIKKVERSQKYVFVYDGLYTVNHYAEDKSAEGKIVFKFHLKRIPGQPSLQTMMKW